MLVWLIMKVKMVRLKVVRDKIKVGSLMYIIVDYLECYTGKR